ncbi:hypothetical protein [Oceanobacter mangrovi]|uniref:hypothetical protein n=1 Tax=Oceanobacter mangrovi TaxID=2862510 RepID=UPI001C8EBE83|nr:hypothetical protein [Oceanobacter mangrovi]
MSWQLLKRLPALALLVGGIVLLQSHSMTFWADQTGDSWTAPVWSLVIELGAVWLWARGNTLVACIATVLALGSPLFDLAQPHYAAWQQGRAAAAANQSSVEQLRVDLARLEAKQATYLKNSERREGWAGLIEKTETQIAATKAELNQTTGQRPPAVDLVAAYQVGIQLLALVLVQVLVVLTTRTVFAPLAASSVGGNSFPKQPRGTQTAAPAAGASQGAGRARAAHHNLTLVKRLAARTGLIQAAS